MKDTVSDIARQILAHTREYRPITEDAAERHPDRDCVVKILDDMRKILFPLHFLHSRPSDDLDYCEDLLTRISELRNVLVYQISRALSFRPDLKESDEARRLALAEEISDRFVSEIPELQRILETDLQAAYEGDPAATGTDEIVYCYPGFSAIMIYRIAHVLHTLDVPLIPRIMTEYAHSKTGVDIHPGATIGERFFIDHGTGVVIGETTVIGDRVKIYQGVTLGGLSTRAGHGLSGKKRHPTIESDVTIYSNASILGGQTVIGEGSVIGGNCFITSSIPPHSKVSYAAPDLRISEDT